jgi:hypothetical protein
MPNQGEIENILSLIGGHAVSPSLLMDVIIVFDAGHIFPLWIYKPGSIDSTALYLISSQTAHQVPGSFPTPP